MINEVYFDNVCIPAANLIGELDRGFHQSMRSLDLERSAMDRIGAARRALDDLAAYIHKEGTAPDGGCLSDLPAVQEKMAELYGRAQVARTFGYLIARRLDAGAGASNEFSYGKLYVGLLSQAIADAAVDIIGPSALFEYGSDLAVNDGLLTALYRASPALTLAGGSSEIQKTIIAVRGLELPK